MAASSIIAARQAREGQSSSGWVCKLCITENLEDEDDCRTCLRSRGHEAPSDAMVERARQAVKARTHPSHRIESSGSWLIDLDCNLELC
jgi:hypothetical protein